MIRRLTAIAVTAGLALAGLAACGPSHASQCKSRGGTVHSVYVSHKMVYYCTVKGKIVDTW
jgi:hypothetical protein